MEINGRIYTINNLAKNSAQVVIKKTINRKQTLIAINVFGKWKDKMDAMKLLKNDKIKGTLYLKSNLYKGKFYTDVYFCNIERMADKKNAYQYANNIKNDLFDNTDSFIKDDNYIVDEETGEILL
jgi:hypothetical protein